MVLTRPGTVKAPHSNAGFSKRQKRLKLISAAAGRRGVPGAAAPPLSEPGQWMRAARPLLPALGHAHLRDYWPISRAPGRRSAGSQWEAMVGVAERGLC